MNPISSNIESKLPFEEVPEHFDFTRFLSDLFGLEPVAAYPVGSWFGLCIDILGGVGNRNRTRLFEIYDLRGDRPSENTGHKRFLNLVHSEVRKTPSFAKLEQAILDYEAADFCSFAGGVCEKCGRITGLAESAPLCFGQGIERPVSAIAKPAPDDPEMDESDEFAKEIAKQLGQMFEPGLIKNFHYDFMLGGVPAFIWRFRDFEMEEDVFLDILERAGRADIEMVYIASYANLVSKIPVSIVGCIPYVLLPLAPDVKDVQVFDYVGTDTVFGTFN